jgi:hypothetical protein
MNAVTNIERTNLSFLECNRWTQAK